ncbi:MAG: GGDEF domain-containing protein [Pseudomonadota bacterium]|nr:GGDEF domain-containing protein [Pseudomonadota bacterium]
MLASQQIFLIAALLCFLTFLVLLSVATDKTQGLRDMLLAAVLGIVSNILYAFGRDLPPVLAYEVANVTCSAASAALLAGYYQLGGLRVRHGLLGASLAGLGVLVALFHYVIDSFAARSIIVSLFQAGICIALARAVLTSRHTWPRRFYVPFFVLSMCFLVASGHLGRVIWLSLATQVPPSLLQPDRLSMAFITASALALPTLGIGWLLMAHQQIVIRAEHVGNHDFLTGASSRKAFFEIAAIEMARAERRTQPVALLLVDMDNFKFINDCSGHAGGDAALVRVVNGARDMLRAIDCVARLGGDEFALLLPGTDLSAATAVATRLQQIVRHAEAAPTLTLSIGVTLIGAGEALTSAMHRADEALYAAKAAGRDCVNAKSPPQPGLAHYRS